MLRETQFLASWAARCIDSKSFPRAITHRVVRQHSVAPGQFRTTQTRRPQWVLSSASSAAARNSVRASSAPMRPAIAALQALRALMKRGPDLLGHRSVKTIIASNGPVMVLYPEIPKPTSIDLLHFSDMYSSLKKTALHGAFGSRWLRDLQGQDFGQEAYLRWLRAAKVSSLLRDKLAECFAGVRSKLFQRAEASIALRAHPAISVLNGSEYSTRLVCYSHDLPVTGTFQTAPPPAESKQVLVSTHRSRMDRRWQSAGVYHRSELLRLCTAVRFCRTQHRLLSKRCCHRHGCKFALSIRGGTL
jgi:hypothetical protein